MLTYQLMCHAVQTWVTGAFGGCAMKYSVALLMFHSMLAQQGQLFRQHRHASPYRYVTPMSDTNIIASTFANKAHAVGLNADAMLCCSAYRARHVAAVSAAILLPASATCSSSQPTRRKLCAGAIAAGTS